MTLILPAPVASAPPRPTPREDPYTTARHLAVEAARRGEAGDVAGEVELLTRAKDALNSVAAPADTQDGIVRLLNTALQKQWERDSDVAHLDVALKLLDEHMQALAASDPVASQDARERTTRLIQEASRLRGSALYQQALVRKRSDDLTGAVGLLEQALHALENASSLADPLAREIVDNLVTMHQEAFADTRDDGHVQAATAALLLVRKAWEASASDARADQLAHIQAQLDGLKRLPILALHREATNAAASGDRRHASELWARACNELAALDEFADPLGLAIVDAMAASAISAAKTTAGSPAEIRALLSSAKGQATLYLERCPQADPSRDRCETQRVQARVHELQGLLGKPTPRPAAASHRPLLISGAALAALGVGGLAVMAAGLGLGKRAQKGLEAGLEENYAELMTTGYRWNSLAWAGGITGGALLVAGGALLAVGLKRRKRSGVAFQPVFTPRMAGAQLSLRF